MAGRITRLRSSEVEPSHVLEDNDETQEPVGNILKQHQEEDQFANMNRISDAHGNPTSNHILAPNELLAEMRQRLKVVRSTTEFKKRSKQSLQNRMGGPKDGTKHCQGSISSMQIAKQMMKDNGKMPIASELFLKTHQRAKGKSFCDSRVEQLF